MKFARVEPTGASVLSLPDPDVKVLSIITISSSFCTSNHTFPIPQSSDPFMDMLAASYNRTRRGESVDGQNASSSSSSSSGSVNRRIINLVDQKDRILVRSSLRFFPLLALCMSSHTMHCITWRSSLWYRRCSNLAPKSITGE